MYSFLSPLKDFDITIHIKSGCWNGRDWVLQKSIDCIINGKELTIPAGFVTDCGSIPRIFRSQLDRMGKSLRAFVLHDYIYRTRSVKISRSVADTALRILSIADGESFAAAKWIYRGVRIGGYFSYKKRGI